MAAVDILVPTYRRAAGLATMLATLVAQTMSDFRLVVSDQTEDFDPFATAEVRAVVGVLRFHGHQVDLLKHLPRRGLAEHRQFLLDQATAPYALFLDDDLILEADAVEVMYRTLREQGCGFAGCAVPSTHYLDDVRPADQQVEFWDGAVQPERIRPDMPEWNRVRLHSAANILHAAQRLGLTPETTRLYKVAWIGACVMFDTAKLRAAGGFEFWRDLPAEHVGEDVLAQMRVMERYGGCGIIPTRAYHQLLETTLSNREVDAPHALL